MNTLNIQDQLKAAGIDSFTSHLSYAEIAKKAEEASQSLDGFAEACYDMNSIDELIQGLTQADETDMAAWGLDEEEYKSAIEQALLAKAYDDLYDDLIEAENDWFESN